MSAQPNWPIYSLNLKSRSEVAERTLEFRFQKPPGMTFKAGQFMAATGFDQDTILADLLRVAAGLGTEPGTVRASLAQALAAGQAKPRSTPA